MRKSKTIILLLCGIVFGLAAFPVFAQETNDGKINRQPLREFGEYIKNKVESNQVDFDKPFKVVLEGFLTPDGNFDKKKSKFTLAEGDEAMVNFAKDGIEAIGDSGFLIYLRNQGAEKIKLTVAQDGETFSTIIESEQKDENRARTVASGLNVMIESVKLLDKNGLQKLDESSKIIINNLQSPKVEGKNVILNFALPKQTFKEMLLRSLPKTNNNQTGE